MTLRSGRDGRVEEVEEETGEAGTLSVLLWKYIVISVWRLCFFISLKMFLCVISPPSTICFCFSALIIDGSMPYKKSKPVLSTLNTSARLSNVSLFSRTASSMSYSSSSSSGSEPLISIKSYFVNSSAVVSVSSWIFPRSVFWDSSPPPTLSCHIHSLFHDFLDWPCHKFYEGKYNTWTVFFSRNLLFGLSWAFVFVCVCVCDNNHIFSRAILPDFMIFHQGSLP